MTTEIKITLVTGNLHVYMQRYTILTVNNRSLELQVTTANVVSLGIERQNIEAFVLKTQPPTEQFFTSCHQ